MRASFSGECSRIDGSDNQPREQLSHSRDFIHNLGVRPLCERSFRTNRLRIWWAYKIHCSRIYTSRKTNAEQIITCRCGPSSSVAVVTTKFGPLSNGGPSILSATNPVLLLPLWLVSSLLSQPRLIVVYRDFTAIYAVYTSPQHPPLPNHLPTLIVTPHGRYYRCSWLPWLNLVHRTTFQHPLFLSAHKLRACCSYIRSSYT